MRDRRLRDPCRRGAGCPRGPRRPRSRQARPDAALRDLQRLGQSQRGGSAPHGPVDRPGSAAAQRRRDHPARAARRPAGQRVRLRRRTSRPRELFQRQLPRGRRSTAPSRSTIRYRVRRAVEHRHRVGLRPRQRRPGRDHARHAARTATTRSASASSRASSAWSVFSKLPDRLPTRRAPSSTSCGRTCRAPCCPTTRRPPRRRLVLARRARRLPAVVEVPLGRADRGRPRRARALPRQPPDAAVFDGPEDRNGTRNHDEIRFWADYVNPAAPAATSTTTTGRHGGLRPGAVLRDRRRPERRPGRRRQHGRRDPAAARQPAHQHELDADEPGRARAVGAAGRQINLVAPGRPGLRHGRLRRHARAGQPARRLRAARSLARGIASSFVFWPLVDRPALPARRRPSTRRCSRTATASRRPTTGSSPSTWRCAVTIAKFAG